MKNAPATEGHLPASVEFQVASVPFCDRAAAGRLLARKLARFAQQRDALVLAVPPGGVPAGFEIAQALQVPLDVFVVRKLGVPGQEEVAMGAIASGGVRVLDRDVINLLAIADADFEAVAEREGRGLHRSECVYRDYRPARPVRGRTVILVDDGIATGATMRVAIRALRHLHAGRVIVATPIAARSTAGELRPLADGFFTVMTPEDFGSVGDWYEDFAPVTNAEVCALLERARAATAEPGRRSSTLTHP